MELACRDLVKRYELGGRSVLALDRVSCSFRSGEAVAVMGKSGSGKTTLLNILGGLDRPTSGSVLVDGDSLYARRDRELSRYRNERVGFVFQSFHLTSGDTALENVQVPFLFARRRPRDAAERARRALEAVELADQVDQPSETLSAGQKQRVAIARALVNEPEIVLADEPTGNLDEETGAGIVALLVDLVRTRGMGVVIVTHDPAIAAAADRRVTIAGGRIVGEA